MESPLNSEQRLGCRLMSFIYNVCIVIDTEREATFFFLVRINEKSSAKPHNWIMDRRIKGTIFELIIFEVGNSSFSFHLWNRLLNIFWHNIIGAVVKQEILDICGRQYSCRSLYVSDTFYDSTLKENQKTIFQLHYVHKRKLNSF